MLNFSGKQISVVVLFIGVGIQSLHSQQHLQIKSFNVEMFHSKRRRTDEGFYVVENVHKIALYS